MNNQTNTYREKGGTGFFFGSAVGETKEETANYNFLYVKANHLGSVRAVVSGYKNPTTNEPTILSLTDYSDFGWAMQGRSFVGENNRFAYQGSERDPEALAGSAYTTEFRMLDVRLGRWFSPDAITHPWQSSYTSMDNNPISIIDPLGLDGDKGPGDVGSPFEGGGTSAISADGTECYVCGPSGGGGTGDVGSSPTGNNLGFAFDAMSMASPTSPAKMPSANPSANKNSMKSQAVVKTAATKPANIAKVTLNTSVDNNDIWDTFVDGAKAMWDYFFGDEKPAPVPDKPVVTGKQAISPVLERKYFSGQSGKTNCKTTCDAILVKNGTKNPSGGTRHEVAGDGTQGKEKILMSAEDVMKIVDEYLENNKPMVAGVNYKDGTQYGTSSDHYIIIVGRGRDKNGFYYTFYDVGTSTEAGTSDENRLYLKDGRFQGSTKYNTDRKYTLSQLRMYGK